MKMLLILLFAAAAMTSSLAAAADQCDYDKTDQSLLCRVRTMPATTGVEELAGANVAARRLTVRCSDLFSSESQLRAEQFKGLPLLEELELEFCKTKQLPERTFAGLTKLRKLSLQSHNSDWSTVVMQVDAHSLSGLGEVLEELDLAHNNLLSVPAGLLCNMSRLRKVNLSLNQLRDALDLGVANSDCRTTFETLDLSHNSINSLQLGDLGHQASSTLLHLNMSHNRISILGDNALDTLQSLQELNLAHNQLAALPPTLFNKSQAMQSLFLQNNSFTLLPSGVFSGLSNLSLLNLSRNAIASNLLNEQTFLGLDSLQILDLSHNQLTLIDPATFGLLPNLRVLHLQHNAIRTVSPESFVRQSLLRVLILSNNKLEALPEDNALAGLTALTSLSLDHNELAGLSDNIFRQTSQLDDLSIDNNKLEEVPKGISALKKLRTLDLGENSIKSLRAGDFNALSNLYGLRLSGNHLGEIEPVHFANVTGLHVLNLARNQLRRIGEKSFDHLQMLRALRLDNNVLADINGIVSSLGKLQWFNVSSNKLVWFDYAFVPTSLEWLDIKDNQIEELGNYYSLKSGFSLKTLDASSNRIKHLTKLSLPASLESINLRQNRIDKIESKLFEDKPDLTRVDLSLNRISHLDSSSLVIGQTSSQKGRPEFLLGGNPFTCGCEMAWLQQVNDVIVDNNSNNPLHHPRVTDLESTFCHNGTVPITQVRPGEFLCRYRTHCFPQCMCCEFYACDCRMQCPEGCDCYHDSAWSTNMIECSARGHTDVPLLIPMDSTHIRLDGNNMSAVDTQSFIGRRRVTFLFLNSSRVTSISRETFAGLSSLQVLHLQDNLLKELHGHEFSSLSSLRELYLQNNDLIHIHSTTFEALTSLAVLRLEGNLLTTFPAWSVLAGKPFLAEVTLSKNMWSCECDFLLPFKQFLLAQRRRIGDFDDVVCMAENLVETSIDLTSQNASCGAGDNKALLQTEVDVFDVSQRSDFVPIVVSAVLALIVVVLGFMAVCVFRARIKMWLYNKSSEIYESRSSTTSSIGGGGGGGVGGNGSTCYMTPQNKLFDVYISYSAKDADFVDQSLAPTLEHGATSYKLCLHQRDFPPSASLYDTVAVATESSSRVIVVLSRSYLDAEWPHVKIPLRNALANSREAAVNGSGKLILLFLDDLDEASVQDHPELRQYAKSCACVRWGSAGFLNKLRFFLPEPAFLTFQRNVTLRTLQPSIPKFPSLLQVDQVSGVWTYTLQSSSSPVGSVATQSTTDGGRQQALVRAGMRAPAPPSVISSVYSHHTYQSIPESHHIYHTLEPNLVSGSPTGGGLGKEQMTSSSARSSPISSIYINRNLDLVLKSESNCSQGEEEEEEEDEHEIRTSFAASSPVGGGGEDLPGSCRGTAGKKKEKVCHHKSQHSTLSAQQLLPSSSSSETSSSSSSSFAAAAASATSRQAGCFSGGGVGGGNDDEYIV